MRPERLRRLREVLARRQPDLTVLLERVDKPHNFSAILRSCDAVGVLEAHVVPPARGIDLSHAVSAGTRKWVRVRTHDDLEAAAAHLRTRGFRIVAADPAPGAFDYRAVDYTLPTALLLGAEKFGISDAGRALADALVMVPMQGMVRSLNVSVATALILYEAMRQREEAGRYAAPTLDAAAFDTTLFEWAYPELAESYRARGEPYPALDEEGRIVER